MRLGRKRRILLVGGRSARVWRGDGDEPARLPTGRGQVVAWRVNLAVDRQLCPRDRNGMNGPGAIRGLLWSGRCAPRRDAGLSETDAPAGGTTILIVNSSCAGFYGAFRISAWIGPVSRHDLGSRDDSA